jgi:glycosyltransferase involved in cell wall biosynthesis
MARVNILITTFNRPDMLKQLLQDIEDNTGYHVIKVFVIDDGSTLPYNIGGKNIFYTKLNNNHGKEWYYKVVSVAFKSQKREPYDYVIMLPDDFRLCDGFFDKAIAAYDAIDDENKICLGLGDSRADKRQWVQHQPVKVFFQQIEYWHTQWNDLCFIATNKFLKALKHRTSKMKVSKGSGVGAYISTKLSAHYNLYVLMFFQSY